MTQVKYNIINITMSAILIGFIFGLSWFLNVSLIQGQVPSPDAIAVRVVPNTNHYSAARWYAEEGFKGSPQALTVDGYEAVRDGRTTYINAANISGTTLETNIYVISYNQEAENLTTDIFGQVLAHWKFNTNLLAPNFCFSSSTLPCLRNNDCPSGDYCLSDKAKVVRDTARMADMVDIESALIQYQSVNGYYPRLQAGTYLPDRTMSVWPSWGGTLGSELGMILPLDPINSLGSCPGYDPVTCWDDKSKTFDGTIPIGLPAGSRVYIYWSQSGGDSYGLCTAMESSYGVASSPYNCAGSVSINRPPVISTPPGLPAVNSGQPYNDSFTVSDPDGDAVTIILDTSPGAPWSLWSTPPQLSVSGNNGTIAADSAGQSGTYNFRIIVDDGKPNGRTTAAYTLTVIGSSIPTVTSPGNQIIIVGAPVSFFIIGSDPDGEYPLVFSVTGLPRGLSVSTVDQQTIQIVGAITEPVASSMTFNATAAAFDSFNNSSLPVAFTITVTNRQPVITSPPPGAAITLMDYSFQIIATDPDGHSIDSYSIQGLPNGLYIDGTGLISGRPDTAGSYPIVLTVEDEYGAQASQSYTFSVNNDPLSLMPISDSTVYLCTPGVCPPVSNVYHPVTYFTTADVITMSPVTFSLSGQPAFLVIHPSTGRIQGTPVSTSDIGSYTVTVTAVTNAGVSQSTSFILTVRQNEWCGDSIPQIAYEDCDTNGGGGTSVTDQYECDAFCNWSGGWCGDMVTQTAYGENCDDGNSNNNDGCTNSCRLAVCGDCFVQTPNGAFFDEECDDCADGDDTNQCFDDCTFTYCGDLILQAQNGRRNLGLSGTGDEECDGLQFSPSDGCLARSYDGGSLSCNADCTVDESACTYTNCGDGVRQSPNNTGSGGPNNDGFEDCDGGDYGGQTCADFGLAGSASRLQCVSAPWPCTIDTSNCCCVFGGGPFGSCVFCP